jgi:nucleoside-triphosphatase THEP1
MASIGRNGAEPGQGNIDPFWPHVAAFGALWGVLEITLGSFLHTLRIPFAGVALASAGAGMLVAQRQVLPRRGAALATGAVAALCKSLSPGGAILGPMTGILVEAALVEVALLAFPRAAASAALGGALAATWAAFQKVFVQVLFYGATVIDLYLAILKKAGEWLGIPPEAGWGALGALLGAIVLLGAGLGLAGWSVGREACRAAMPMAARPRKIIEAGVGAMAGQGWPALQMDMGGQATGRRCMVASALACVAMQFPGDLAWSAAAFAAWLAATAAWDRAVLRRMWMPRFWIVSCGLAVLSGLLLGERDVEVLGVGLSASGLEAGGLMVVRGGLVYGLASWASRAVGGRRFRHAMAAVGLAPLGSAVSVAVELLPDLTDAWQAARLRGTGASRAARTFDGAVGLVRETVRLAREVAARPAALATGGGRPRVVAVVGDPGTGKTTMVAAVAAALRRRGLAVAGIAQPASGDGPDRSYALRDVVTGQERAFAARRADGGPGFDFEEDGWAWARARIEDAITSADVVVVDELGRLEADGRGHVAGLDGRGGRARWIVAAVRADCSAAIQARLGGFDTVVEASRDPEVAEALVEALVKGMRERTEGEG